MYRTLFNHLELKQNNFSLRKLSVRMIKIEMSVLIVIIRNEENMTVMVQFYML